MNVKKCTVLKLGLASTQQRKWRRPAATIHKPLSFPKIRKRQTSDYNNDSYTADDEGASFDEDGSESDSGNFALHQLHSYN